MFGTFTHFYGYLSQQLNTHLGPWSSAPNGPICCGQFPGGQDSQLNTEMIRDSRFVAGPTALYNPPCRGDGFCGFARLAWEPRLVQSSHEIGGRCRRNLQLYAIACRTIVQHRSDKARVKARYDTCSSKFWLPWRPRLQCLTVLAQVMHPSLAL